MSQQKEKTENDLDFILKDIGGTFGKFQIYHYVLITFTFVLSSLFVLDFVFSTLDLNYRCHIPECDVGRDVEYNPVWLEHFVPFENSKPKDCLQYQPISHSNDIFVCDATAFNQSSVVPCASGEFIYETDEVSIVNEFNITCQDSKWKLSMVGVVNNIARLMFIPIFGHFSDRFGRAPILITLTLLAGILKFITSFSTSYELFVVFTFLDAAVCSAIYPTSFILAMEWAITEKRVLVSSIVMSLCPLGDIITAFVASQTHNFKLTLRIISLPPLLVVCYIWLLHESLRWNMTKKKYDRAIATIDRAAKINNVQVSQRTYDIVAAKCKRDDGEMVEKVGEQNSELKAVFTSGVLLVRFISCAVAWIGCIFVTYGTTIMSVTLQGDIYWNYTILTAAAFPCVITSYYMLTYMNRRYALCASMVASGVTILLSYYIQHWPVSSLLLYIVSRILVRHACLVMYVYTGEMWPTSVRHSILGVCSMFGRIGSIVGALTPLMAQYSEVLPYALFFGMAVLSGLLFTLTPETFGIELPDTVEQAQSIGSEKSDKNCR